MNYDMPLARNSDPMTSHAAADACAAIRKSDEAAILAALHKHGPMGKDGIGLCCHRDGVAVARRMKALETNGMVRRTGRTVMSNTGRAETEWAAV